jgi:sugar phosphate isomerase/epimerase
MTMGSNVKLGLSIYSLTREIASRRLSFADCIGIARDLGVDGIEILSTQSLPGYPWPTAEQLFAMRDCCEKYSIKIVCYDSFLEHGIRPDRFLKFAEMFRSSFNDLSYASQLGVRLIRLLPTTPVALIEKLLPYAEKLQLKLAVEINEPMKLNSREVLSFLALQDRVGPDHFGFVFDFDTFTVSGTGPEPEELADFSRMIPRICHYHGKFYNLDEQGDDCHIPAPVLLPMIRDAGFSGYVMSEYRGYDRSTEDTMIVLDRQLSRYRQILQGRANV